MKITRLFDMPYRQLETDPLEVAFATKENGEWKKLSTAEFINQFNAFSRGLLKMGVKPGDRIALINHVNITSWHIMDYGIQQVGGVSVPVYPTISSEDYAYIFNDAEVKFCFVTNKDLYDKVDAIKDQVPSLVGLYSIDEIAGAPNWKEVMGMGEDDATQHEVDHLKELIKPSDLVTLIYTSGTTGRPKGVMLTHDNIVSNVMGTEDRFPEFPPKPIALSFLPICHIFERMLTYIYQYKGIGIYFAESLEKIADNLKEVKPETMSVVPRLLEKVYASIYEKGQAAGGVKTKLFNWAISLVENYEPYKKYDMSYNIKYGIASKLVFSKWREGLGGNLIAVISGAAALSPRLCHVFWGAGIPVLEGYGMTETSPVISVNALSKSGVKIGTVGKVIENVTVKIAEDGEILVKGSNVTQGYLNSPEKTAELFTPDGYLCTGDVGIIDSEGFLKITDRKKEMFKTSGGKYIAPQPIENEMKQSRFIEQIMIAGEGEKMPVAIVQPNFVYIQEWAKENKIPVSNNQEIANHPQVNEAVFAEIEKINKKLGKWEQVKKIALTPDEWTIDAGLLTPTMKMKRKAIMEKYKSLYESLYDR